MHITHADYLPCNDYALFTTGYTEKQQLLRFIADNTTNESKHFVRKRKVIVKFSTEKVTVFDCCVVIRLIDSRGRQFKDSLLMLGGGASLQSLALSDNRVYSCPFVDHFNGTYDVVCRLYDECHNISITLSYVHYGAFKWDKYYLGMSLFSKTVCRHQPGLKHNFGPYIGWYRDKTRSKWRWMRGDKEMMTDDQSRSCIARLPYPILLFGDSHLCFTLYFWLQLINKFSINTPALRFSNHTFKVDKFVMTHHSFILDENEQPALR